MIPILYVLANAVHNIFLTLLVVILLSCHINIDENFYNIFVLKYIDCKRQLMQPNASMEKVMQK